MRTFLEEIEVRGYELDSFGHVNHAVYLSYFEHARWQALWAAGLDPGRFRRGEIGVYVVRVEADFTAELSLGDSLRIETAAEELRNSSMTLHQTAHRVRDDKVSATLRVTLAWVNSSGRPTRMPEDARAGLSQDRP